MAPVAPTTMTTLCELAWVGCGLAARPATATSAGKNSDHQMAPNDLRRDVLWTPFAARDIVLLSAGTPRGHAVTD